MNELDIELPLMKYPLKVKSLKDYTNICTCKLPELNKYCLVIDTRVDTVLFFHFESKIDLLKAVLIKAKDKDEYLDKLFIKFPLLKAWIPTIPFGEPGDVIHVRLMDNREFYTDDIHWEYDNSSLQFHFKLGNNYDEIIHIEDIRFLHVQYTQETFSTLDELITNYNATGSPVSKDGVDNLTLVLEMAMVHLKNYHKRLLRKQIDEQNNQTK